MLSFVAHIRMLINSNSRGTVDILATKNSTYWLPYMKRSFPTQRWMSTTIVEFWKIQPGMLSSQRLNEFASSSSP